MDTGAVLASLTHAATTFQDSTSGSLPADTIRTRGATLPARMRVTGYIRGLPCRHAVIVAKHALGMEITRGPRYRGGAPVARLCYLIGATRIGLEFDAADVAAVHSRPIRQHLLTPPAFHSLGFYGLSKRHLGHCLSIG